MKLTAVIICRSRREKGFERALASVGFADEILVEERRETGDFAAARNEALKKAKGEWVVFVDSDEEVSEGLKREIQKVTDKDYKYYKNYNISGAYFSGVYFRRRDRFLGKWLKFGETASVRLLRLARRGVGKWDRPVHEVWKIDGRIVELKNPIWHYSHESVDGMVEKLDGYSQMEAEYRVSRWLARWRKFARSPSPARYRSGQAPRPPAADSGWPQTAAVSLANLPTSLTFPARNLCKSIILIQLIFFPIFKFIQNYFWRLGVLDGMEGLIHALMMAGHSFLVRAKLLSRMDANQIKRMNANKRIER